MSSFLLSVFAVILGIILLTLIIGYILFNKQKRSKYQTLNVPNNASFGMQIQLTAYERLVLFIERSYPPNLVEQHYNKELSTTELQTLFIRQITEEFQHNISQQVYVSTQVWEHLREYKERTIMYINLLADSNKQQDCKTFATNIIEFFNEKEQRATYLLLLDALRFEVRAGVLKV